jgi:hypothetical protein
MAYVTCPHVWSYQAGNQWKTLGRKKNLLSFWALDKSVRMFYYHLSSIMFVRVWRCSLLYIWIMRACLLCPYVKHCFLNSMFTLDIFVVWCVDGKFIVLCVSTLIFYFLEYIHFLLWTLIDHSYDVWDRTSRLLVADGTIMYDASSHQPCDQWYFYQDHLVLPVSKIYNELWDGWVVSPWPWHLQELFCWGCEYWSSLWTNMYHQFVLNWCSFELSYWLARSVSRVPRRHASLLCQWVLLHGWLILMWRSLKMSSLLGRYDFPRCYRPIPLSCGRTNSYNIFLRSHQTWASDRYAKRHESHAW